VIAVIAGLLSALGNFYSAKWFQDPLKSGLDAAFDAAILIVIGIGIAAFLDHRAAEREHLFRARARAEQLARLGPGLKLAANGWVHRPGHSAPEGEDFSVAAGLKELESRGKDLEQIELALREQHEQRVPVQDLESATEERVFMGLYCQKVSKLSYQYWFEGGRASRFAHLSGLRRFLEAEVVDADEDVRARFTAFASALDLAEAARHKTDAVVQERLVMSAVGLEDSMWLDYVHHGGETETGVRSVAHTAQGTDSVLHLSFAAATLGEQGLKPLRESDDRQHEPSDTFTHDVLVALNRCIGALEHEVANVRIVLLRLSEFVGALEQKAWQSAGPGAI